jgi:cell division septum initiation protein DivIVA
MRLRQLTAAAQAAHNQSAELAHQIEALKASEAAARRQASVKPAAPSYTDFGVRISQMLSLAEEEATEIRANADAEISKKLRELEASNIKLRTDAERFAVETRSASESEAARIVEDAKRGADQLLDEADRHSSARREEAEAVYEQQRAQAAQAAADFEQTLAERRQRAEHDFRERTSLAERQLETAQEHGAQMRIEAERAHAESTQKSSRLLQEAEQKAAQIVAEARASADRIRTESERELAAATQRRDSINAQLTNVRQMLATLSGTTPANIPLDQPEAVAEQPKKPAPAAKPAAPRAADGEQGGGKQSATVNSQGQSGPSGGRRN